MSRRKGSQKVLFRFDQTEADFIKQINDCLLFFSCSSILWISSRQSWAPWILHVCQGESGQYQNIQSFITKLDLFGEIQKLFYISSYLELAQLKAIEFLLPKEYWDGKPLSRLCIHLWFKTIFLFLLLILSQQHFLLNFYNQTEEREPFPSGKLKWRWDWRWSRDGPSVIKSPPATNLRWSSVSRRLSAKTLAGREPL